MNVTLELPPSNLRHTAKRLVRTALALASAVVALHGWGVAVANELRLVSITAGGVGGSNDSGWVAAAPRRSAVTDSGEVYFLSAAALAPTDFNAVVDVYRYSSGTVAAIDLAGFTAPGDVLFLDVDGSGQTRYIVRETAVPGIAEVRLLTGSALRTIDSREGITGVAVSANGEFAVYSQHLADNSDLFRESLTSIDSPVVIGINPSDNTVSGAVNEDGQVVALASNALNLGTPGLGHVTDIFKLDLSTSQFTLASTADSNVLRTEPAEEPALADSADVIAFSSSDAAFDVTDSNGVRDIFISDAGGAPIRVRHPTLEPDGPSQQPQLSADGRYLVFASLATTFTGDGNAHYQIIFHDRMTNTFHCLSEVDGALANADCLAPAISANGRFVTFVSAATNLVTTASSASRQVYRVDRQASPPQLSFGEAVVHFHGEPSAVLPREQLVITDEDSPIGDDATLQLQFLTLPEHGVLSLDGETPIATDQLITVDALPLFWLPTEPNAPSSETVSVRLVSPEGLSDVVLLRLVAGAVTQTLNLARGWNLVSFAIDLLDSDWSAVSAAATPMRSVLRPWTTTSTGLQCVDEVEAGSGYWMFAVTDVTLGPVVGLPISDDVRELASGAHLVGPVGQGDSGIIEPEILASAPIFHSWLNATTEFTTTTSEVRRGVGYWIHWQPEEGASFRLLLTPAP